MSTDVQAMKQKQFRDHIDEPRSRIRAVGIRELSKFIMILMIYKYL
jgi:hypothetical protein